MKIESGKEYICTQTDIMQSQSDKDGKPCFTRGFAYLSSKDGHLIDNFGNDHSVEGGGWHLDKFVKVEQNKAYLSLADFPNFPNPETPKNDPINPDHYKSYSVETIDMMIAIYGKEKVAIHCELTAFKYRMRAGKKGAYAECIAKEKWYLDKAKELRDV